MLFSQQDLESDPCTLSFAKNGQDLGQCFDFEKSKLGEKAMFPHVLVKNTSLECNFGAKVCSTKCFYRLLAKSVALKDYFNFTM